MNWSEDDVEHEEPYYPISKLVAKAVTVKVLLRSMNFNDSSMKCATLIGVDARFSTFDFADLEEADFSDSDLSNCSFEDCEARNARFDRAVLEDANFENAYLKYASFKNTNLSNATFKNADLSFVNFENANLEEAILSDLDNISVDYEGSYRLESDSVPEGWLMSKEGRRYRLRRDPAYKPTLSQRLFVDRIRESDDKW